MVKSRRPASSAQSSVKATVARRPSVDTSDLKVVTSTTVPDVAVSREAEGLPADGAAALLCVERDAEACHRSLVAGRLAERFGAAVRHLLPPSG